MPSLLLAVDIGNLIYAIVLVIGFLSWIIGLVSKKQNPAPPVRPGARRPPRPGDPQVREEIEVFLRDAANRPAAPRAGQPRPVERFRESRRPAASRPKAPTPTRSRRAQRPQRPNLKQPPKPKPGEEIAHRHMAEPDRLGSGVREHVAEHLAEHIPEHHLGEEVDASVEAHLGTFSGAERTGQLQPAQRPSTAEAVHRLLRNPVGLREAIVVSEILQPPKCKRAHA